MREQQSAIQPAIEALQSGPVIVWGGGRPVLNVGWHKEVSVRHAVGRRGKFEAAAFQDDDGHEAVFGIVRQASANSAIPPGLFAGPIARDAGGAQFWGTRIIYREKLTDDMEIDGVYAWAGALVAGDGASASPDLQDAVLVRYRHSVAARLAGLLPRTKTQFAASYKWIDGSVLSRQDLYGESAMGIDPNLSVAIRQPLPSFLLAGHWEALADFRNILAQGYVPLDLQDGHMLVMPVERSFRGGLSFQF